MKRHLTVPLRRESLLALTLGVFTYGCGSKGGSPDEVAPHPPDSPEEAAPAEGQEEEEAPAPASPPSPSEASLGSLVFHETSIDLPGDFRVKKVEKDAAGDFYLALISEVQGAPAYAVIKLASDGKELWRFPTLSSLQEPPANGERSSPYLRGLLRDMHVTKDGRVWLIGLQDSRTEIDFGVVNWRQISWGRPVQNAASVIAGNTTFIRRIDGAGRSANSPTMTFSTLHGAPSFWQPRSIRVDGQGAVVIASSSERTGANHVTQQVQKVSPDFKDVLSSTCFVSPIVNAPVDEGDLVNIVSAAAKSIGDRMDAPLEPNLEPLTGRIDYQYVYTEEAFRQAPEGGRCWDLFRSNVMTSDAPSTKIIKPVPLAEGAEMKMHVAKLGDLATGASTFEAYAFSSPAVAETVVWAYYKDYPPVSEMNQAQTRWITTGQDLLYLGMDAADISGHRMLVIGNGRSTVEESWKKTLKASSLRSPGSLDLFALADGGVAAAWTDVHLTGEANEGHRALNIAYLPNRGGKGEPITHSFDVPEAVGYASFSSVRIHVDSLGRIAAFATAGEPDPKISGPHARMQNSTLVIGMSK